MDLIAGLRGVITRFSPFAVEIHALTQTLDGLKSKIEMTIKTVSEDRDELYLEYTGEISQFIKV